MIRSNVRPLSAERLIMVETVKKYCVHDDCRYRSYFDKQPCCIYMIITGYPRDCKISECNKYKAGKKKLKSCLDGFHYVNDL